MLLLSNYKLNRNANKIYYYCYILVVFLFWASKSLHSSTGGLLF